MKKKERTSGMFHCNFLELKKTIRCKHIHFEENYALILVRKSDKSLNTDLSSEEEQYMPIFQFLISWSPIFNAQNFTILRGI